MATKSLSGINPTVSLPEGRAYNIYRQDIYVGTVPIARDALDAIDLWIATANEPGERRALPGPYMAILEDEDKRPTWPPKAASPFVPPKHRYSFDPRCRDLADYFALTSGWTDSERDDLAQTIQDAIEGWMFMHERDADPDPASANAECLGG